MDPFYKQEEGSPLGDITAGKDIDSINIVATIEDVECKEGDEVRFKAVITGDPNPEITWMINGIPLSESEKVRFISEDGICILIIKDVTRHFDGTVTCQTQVNVVYMTFRQDSLAVVSFEVDISGFPDPTVVFLLKGNELKHGVNGVDISGSDGYYKLVINDCLINEHDGELICRAVNEHGSAESRARLTVEQQEEESRSAPTFIKDIEDQTVKSGELAVFETTVRGNPIPSVTWFINGQKMDSNSSGIKIEVVNHDHKITIDSAQYAGTVLCRAENCVGRFETKARLVVLPQESPKKAPRFIELLSDKCEIEENTVVFEARIEAEPEPLIKWYLKGEQLKSSDKVEIREFDGSIKLELKNISLEDAGEIKCIAENSEGSAESSANLSVSRKSFAPIFDQQPKSITVEKETEARFEAHAEGNPLPNYQWSIDGRKVRENTEGANVSSVNGVSVLTIDTSVHGSSTISVVAENSLGMDETGARLTVEEKKIPKITRELSNLTVNKGDLGHFETIIENATDVKWFHNGTELISGSPGIKISQDDRFEFRLSIDSSIFTTGTISAKGSNKAGCEMKVFEDIKESKQPEFTDGLQDIEVIKGEPFHMDVIALHSPHFQWTLNGIHMEDGKNGVHIVEEGNKSSLIVDRAEDIHSGKGIDIYLFILLFSL
uniref:Immunoglobulin I-set domain protein n=1 Tax=Heterorhabditis bacteriophora TaxID=37862 RepID=A0A1I7XGY0_HETBA